MKLSDIAKRMILVIFILFTALVAGSIAYYRSLSFLPFALGAFLGSAASIVKVILLERSVDKIMGMEQAKAGKYILLQQLLRFAVTGAALLPAAVFPFVNLWGAVGGVLAFQFAIFCTKKFFSDDSAKN